MAHARPPRKLVKENRRKRGRGDVLLDLALPHGLEGRKGPEVGAWCMMGQRQQKPCKPREFRDAGSGSARQAGSVAGCPREVPGPRWVVAGREGVGGRAVDAWPGQGEVRRQGLPRPWDSPWL